MLRRRASGRCPSRRRRCRRCATINGTAGATVGLVAAFIGYAQRLAQPLSRLGNIYTSVIAALVGAERIFEIVDSADLVDSPDAMDVGQLVGHVVFYGVDFSVPASRS